MDTTTAKRQLAELTALHKACEKTDEKLSSAAHKIHDFHNQRQDKLQKLLDVDRRDDLLEDYQDSLRERDIAARYLR